MRVRHPLHTTAQKRTSATASEWAESRNAKSHLASFQVIPLGRESHIFGQERSFLDFSTHICTLLCIILLYMDILQ